MSGVLGKSLSNAPNIQLLEEEQAARSIVVSNISPQTTKEDVTIHFQGQKNGGGEINAVHIPVEGTAVITFEESEGSEKLHGMQKTHSTGEPNCSMCMNLNKDPVYPAKCGHYFCKSCTKHFIEKTMICPVCKKENQPRANQPLGYMTRRTDSLNSLPGYEEFATIVLTFNFDKGIQGSEHPNPGEPYCGLFCTSYLPNNPAGREVCNLLRSAFNARLIFTFGNCPATGEKNKIVPNGIDLKWNRNGGSANCGYPDPSYLDRVKSQLAEKGITQPLN